MASSASNTPSKVIPAATNPPKITNIRQPRAPQIVSGGGEPHCASPRLSRWESGRRSAKRGLKLRSGRVRRNAGRLAPDGGGGGASWRNEVSAAGSDVWRAGAAGAPDGLWASKCAPSIALCNGCTSSAFTHCPPGSRCSDPDIDRAVTVPSLLCSPSGHRGAKGSRAGPPDPALALVPSSPQSASVPACRSSNPPLSAACGPPPAWPAPRPP